MSSGKHLEDITQAHIVSLMYKLLTSSKDTDDLSIVFDRSRDRRKRELPNYKNVKGKFHLRIYLGDIFGFAEHQETDTYGFSYKLTLTRINDKAVLNKNNATNKAKIKINASEWYVPHYTPSFEEDNKLMNQITKKIPTNLLYRETSVFMKEVNTQTVRTFELGVQESFNVPIWIYVVFQQSDRQHDQKLNNDTFYKLPVTSAQCIFGTDKYPDSAIFLTYNDDHYFQAYGQFKEVLKALIKDNILQPFIREEYFKSSDDGDNIGYNNHAFHIRYQKNCESGESFNVKFKLDGVVLAGIYGYALVLTIRLVRISSDDSECLT